MSAISRLEFVNHFARELQSGDAGLFVGAGLSVPSGFVNWKALMRDVATELGLDIERESDLIALAQYHVNDRNGRDRINRLLVDEFTKDAKLTDNHKLIALLPIKTIWTTNYDELLESAFREAHRRPDVKITNENLATTMPNRDVVIYKMHGDCRQPQDAVLTKEDYETYGQKREVFSTALKGDLVERTFLFLGFSFTDPNIDYILSRIRGLLGQNQRTHYCLMKRPNIPKSLGGAEQAEYEYQKRKLELRIADLARYQIQAVMIDEYSEVTEILTELKRRSHLTNVFVSGSSHVFEPLGKARLESLCARIGREIIERNLNLVSGLGVSVGGAVTLGALERIHSKNLTLQRLSLFPFPQQQPEFSSQEKFFDTYRRNMLSNAGFAIFISGNRPHPDGVVKNSSGVMREFEIATELDVIPIPLGASGWTARSIWEVVSEHQTKYYGSRDVKEALATLGQENRSDSEYVDAIFKMIGTLSA
jgi:Sir2- and TIR-associating SLOG family/SIR2-like domain